MEDFELPRWASKPKFRQRFPYKSLICEMLHLAAKDELRGYAPVDWENIPWKEHVDIPVFSIKNRVKRDDNS